MENGKTLQTTRPGRDGSFAFLNVVPKAGYKIRVVKNRIEALYYTQANFLPGQTLTFSVNSLSTARALVFESLKFQDPLLTISSIKGEDVALLAQTIEAALSKPNHLFTFAGQSILTTPEVTSLVNSTSASIKISLSGKINHSKIIPKFSRLP